jgi:hypothetical protein
VSQSDNQPLSGDGDLTEQKEIEGVECCEMETSGTSSSDVHNLILLLYRQACFISKGFVGA